MLARPTKSYSVVFDRFANRPFTCEYKYDGERAQIHITNSKTISIFSRNFENSTERFPDVVAYVKEALKEKNVQSAIIDAEVVAFDTEKQIRLPFQVLSTRSRKHVSLADIKVKICIYAFDLLYFNDEPLLTTPLTTRRKILHDNFSATQGVFEYATCMDVSNKETGEDAEELEVKVDLIRNFLQEAVQNNCEGLMVKTLEDEATYEPANRSHKWLKLKKDYLEGIGDSVDLVPVGAFHGRGKRTGVYGAYLLACYDREMDVFQMTTKLGTGLSDERLKQFYSEMKQYIIPKPRNDYAICEDLQPDVWFDAKVVWEILGADLSISPRYTAAIGHVARDKGISLRFPRFIRERDDKNPTDATTSSQIADLYRAQGLASAQEENEFDDDDAL